MARIFITGSADGLGQLAAKLLIDQGHHVVIHARNATRAKEALRIVKGAEKVLIADLASMEETKLLAQQVNDIGTFDAVIHNAGVYQTSGDIITAVNTFAPYILTCLITKPKRLIYMSSGMHSGGRLNLENLEGNTNKLSYSDSKLQVVTLAMAVARKWPEVFSNAVNPGWVPTRMGGKGAPDDLDKGVETQAWLSVSDDADATVSGKYFHHKKVTRHKSEADSIEAQEKFLSVCEQVTGVKFPK